MLSYEIHVSLPLRVCAGGVGYTLAPPLITVVAEKASMVAPGATTAIAVKEKKAVNAPGGATTTTAGKARKQLKQQQQPYWWQQLE